MSPLYHLLERFTAMSRPTVHSSPTVPFSQGQGLKLATAELAGVRDFLVLDILKEANGLASEGLDVIHMEAGQPAQGAPRIALAAAERALKEVRLGYTEACGRPALREGIAAHYQAYYGCPVLPSQVVVTTGSSAAFSLGFLTLASKHRRMAFPVPGYPAYRSIAAAYGIDVVDLPANAANGWMPDPDDIVRLHRHKGLDAILIASPNNPTGKMIDPEVMDRIVEVCEREGIWIIADEIYHGLTFRGRDETVFAKTEHALIINSFSKYYGMTGWRIGWMVAAEPLVRKLETLAQHLFISPPTLSQIVAEAALRARDELDLRVAAYKANRDIVVNGLIRAGVREVVPVDGAFYAYADISNFSNNSMAFARELLADTGVATTPGLDFDIENGARYLRLSFAESQSRVEEAMERFAEWVSKRSV